MSEVRPLAVLIAAMGGEGGGVLANWLVAAAGRAGFAVQATSIPGVAQRTGATTYYLEIWPEKLAAGAPEPVFALYPTPGEVDLVIASELVEAARAVENGYVAPDRTVLVASTHRVYAIGERAAMADGRVDSERLREAAAALSRRAVLADFREAAGAARAALNAVLLGAAAQSGALPISAAEFRAAVEAEGKAVAANLAGFAAGERLAAGEDGGGAATAEVAAPRLPEALESAAAGLDLRVAVLARAGAARLIDYQGEAYAAYYMARLAPVAALSRDAAEECARQLALRMSYEDVVRVAQIKTGAQRFAALRDEVGAAAGQPVRVHEYLKPGLEEWCALLPPRAARALLRWAARRRMEERFSFAMRIRSDTVLGFVLLRLVVAMRPLRRFGWRWHEEQRRIDDWLGLVTEAARRDGALAVEVAALAGLVKGYGSTFRRGVENYERIAEALVRPWLESGAPAGAAGALRRAREAAVSDPDGKALSAYLETGGAAAA